MAEKSGLFMIKQKRFTIFSPRFFVFAAIGVSAFTAGVFFALPVAHSVFARVNFARASVMAEVADTAEARMRGLSGRSSLAELNGMLFVNEKSEATGIWMKDMKFPIDILWIRNGTVVDMKERITHDTYPEIFMPKKSAMYVLEVKSGGARKNGIVEGSTLLFTK